MRNADGSSRKLTWSDERFEAFGWWRTKTADSCKFIRLVYSGVRATIVVVVLYASYSILGIMTFLQRIIRMTSSSFADVYSVNGICRLRLIYLRHAMTECQ